MDSAAGRLSCVSWATTALDEKRASPQGIPRLLKGWERHSAWSSAVLRSYAFAMRRICFTVVGAYLAVALLGHALERSGVAACDCREACWCKLPGLNLFRWAFPFRHSRPC